jgi:hypothetical protein
LPDCLIGYLLPCLEAGIASKNADRGICMTALQCFFYPLCLPFLRCQVRQDRGIDVNAIKYTIISSFLKIFVLYCDLNFRKQGNICGDVISGLCCPCCTAIQIKVSFFFLLLKFLIHFKYL